MVSARDGSAELPAWTVVSSALVFDHLFLKLAEDIIELPAGGTESFIRFADHRDGEVVLDGAGALCRREDGRFLVSREWCLGPEKVVHMLPGGARAPGETLEDAVRRELQEEVGLWPRTVEHLGAVLADNRRSSARIHIYLATDLEDRFLPSDPSEVIAWDWMSEADIEMAIADKVFEHAYLLAGWAMYKAQRRHRSPSDGEVRLRPLEP